MTMAYDGGMLCAVLHELNRMADGAKVEKIFQPGREEIDLCLVAHGTRLRFCINAGASSPHMAFTAQQKENPATAPLFCMLLRKHLAGAHFTHGEQTGFDRVARLCFSAYDEMGYPTEKYLHVEIMGKCSNLILTDAEEKILAVLRPVDFSTSRVRQVLPGMQYTLPPAQEKRNPLTESRTEFVQRVAGAPGERNAARYLCDTYQGLAMQTAYELVYRACHTADARLETVGPEALADAFCAWFDAVRAGEFSPVLVRRAGDGTPLDFTYRVTGYRGSAAYCETFPDFGQLLDRYFGARDLSERIRQRSADLHRMLANAEGRLLRKLEMQRQELSDCASAEEHRRDADLIVANIYRLTRGMTEFTGTDYSGEEPEERTVHLDRRLSPSANAQHLYKLYNKARTAQRVLREQIAQSEAELIYLSGVRSFLEHAESEADLTELRDELHRAGYASRMKGYTTPKNVRLRPREYVSSGGYRILCGRNNLQNEQLTFHTAGKEDLWFHAKGIPGSHVILVCGGEEPGASDYTEAAELAAYYSAATGDTVAVDYTRVRNLKKPPGSKPGYVTYKSNYTAYVAPRLLQEAKKP